MKQFGTYLKRLVKLHNEMLTRVVNNDQTRSLDLAELFEDVGNCYLDVSDQIRAAYLREAQVAGKPCPTGIPLEEIPRIVRKKTTG